MISLRNKKGMLVFVFGVLLFLAVLEFLFVAMARTSRERIMRAKNRHIAEDLARAGLNYAELMIDRKKWNPNAIEPCPGKFTSELVRIDGRICLKEIVQSPVLVEPGGIFEISLYSYAGNFFRIKSVGFMGHSRHEMTKEIFGGFSTEEIEIEKSEPTESPNETDEPSEIETPSESPSPEGTGGIVKEPGEGTKTPTPAIEPKSSIPEVATPENPAMEKSPSRPSPLKSPRKGAKEPPEPAVY